jgi:hypothetical protein
MEGFRHNGICHASKFSCCYTEFGSCERWEVIAFRNGTLMVGNHPARVKMVCVLSSSVWSWIADVSRLQEDIFSNASISELRWEHQLRQINWDLPH